MVKAIAINCSLKADRSAASSTDLMISVIANELSKHGVDLVETIRIASYNILPGRPLTKVLATPGPTFAVVFLMPTS